MHVRVSIWFRLLVVALFSFATSHSLIAQQDKETQFIGNIIKLDDALDELIDSSLKLEVLGTGYRWSEGPVWDKANQRLLFSDVPSNRIHQWREGQQVSVFLEKSGFDKPSKTGAREPGSNGLMFDHQGRLTVCDHGNRRVYRLEQDGSKTTLIERFKGKRFNSPNDLVFDKEGNLYFTDPPYGLPSGDAQELDFFGVYRLTPGGTLSLLHDKLFRPNGIALSPDEKTLYVAQSHKPKAVYVAFSIQDDGQLDDGKVLFDATEMMGKDPGSPDGMVIDAKGNLWATGPGGVLIISPKGKLLGRIMTGRATANCTFGQDGSTLFMTAGNTLCRVKTKVKGLGY